MFANEVLGSIPIPSYYPAYPTNLCSEITLELTLDHRGYGFAYDDVHENGIEDVSGLLEVHEPKLLAVGVGGYGANKNDSDVVAGTLKSSV